MLRRRWRRLNRAPPSMDCIAAFVCGRPHSSLCLFEYNHEARFCFDSRAFDAWWTYGLFDLPRLRFISPTQPGLLRLRIAARQGTSHHRSRLRKRHLIPGGANMKTVFAAVIVAVLAVAASAAADAKGCIKGAIVGGVAGHYAAHHGMLG